MKQLIKNVKRLALALCLATPIVSWAAEPIAEWGPGDFPVSARGTNAVTDEQSGVTISKNNLNNTSTSGYIAVSETGNDSGWPITLSGNYSALTVVVAYQLSSSASGSIIALANANGSGRVNANIQDGNLYGGQGSATTHDLGFSSPANEGVVHTLAMAYSPSDGTAFYFDGVKSETDCSGFKEDGNVTEVCLGAYRGPNNIIKGIRYYYVAVYDSKLGDDDAVAACASALDGFVTVSSSGVALDAATYNDKDVTFVGEEGGYLTVDESIALSSLTAAGKPLTIKVNPGATLSAESINAVDTTVDLSGWDLTAFARNAVVGAPYRIWPILSPSATGSITYDTTGATIPSGYTATTVQTAIGPALEFTTELQFGSLSINFCGTYDGVNDSGARVSDNASYSGINHGAFPVIGTSWNDVPGQNASDVAVPTYIDNLGVVHTDGSALVTLSQVKNAWDLYGKGTLDRILYGYCDDGNGTIVTVENIPFEKFRVIAYAATDSNDTVFSPKTINNVVYSTGAAGSTATPTLSGRPDNVGWGATSSRSQLLEGVNYLVSDVISGTTTVTINNPKNVGRAGIPAVQIVEVGVEYAVERKNFDDGDKYTIDSLIDANSVVVTCDGSITIEGTENYTVTERDLEIMDFSGVEGTVTLGEHTQITLGADRTLPGGKIAFGEGSTVVITETSEEYGKDMFSVAGLTGVSYVKLLHRDCILTVTDGVASYGDGTDVKIDGAATMYDATFTNTTAFAYKNSSGAAIGLDTAVDPKYNNEDNDETTGIYIRHHPYVNGAASDIYRLSDFTVLVVGQMSPTHKTQFIHLGSTANSNTGLLIATTENDDEVIIAPNKGKVVDTSNAVTVSVPNAATARHVYVITKVGNTFTVSVDGIRRGNFTVADGWTIGASGHSGVQVGSDFGGEIQRNESDPNRFKAVANSQEETGVINVMRVFDYVVSDAQIQAIIDAYPYESAGGHYTRTIDGDANFSSENAWDRGDASYDVPVGAAEGYNPSATITVEDAATLTVNAALTLETLTVLGGAETLTFAKDGDNAVKVSGAAVFNSPVVVEYGALDLSGTPVQIGSAGSLTIDCSSIDVASIYATKHYQLTGLTDDDPDKFDVISPAGAPAREVSVEYNANGYYELVISVDHEAGSDVYYKNGYFGTTESSFAVTNSAGSATAVFPGDTVVIPEYTSGSAYFGATLPANVSAIRVEGDFTFEPGVSDPILDGTTVTVSEGKTLTFGATWHGLNLGDVTLNGPGAVTIDGSKSSNATDVDAGTFRISGAVAGSATITIAAGKAVTAESTSSVANAIVLEAGATLTVKDGAGVCEPGTAVAHAYVKETSGDGETVYSVEVMEAYTVTILTSGGNEQCRAWLAAGDSVVDNGNGSYTVYSGANVELHADAPDDYDISATETVAGGEAQAIEPEEEEEYISRTITADTIYTITFKYNPPVAMVCDESGERYFDTLESAISYANGGTTVTLLQNCPDALVLEKAITIDVGETVSFGAGIDITVNGGYVITDETTEINKSYNTTWVVDVLDPETTPRRVKYGYGVRRTVKMDYLSGAGNVVVTTGDLVRRVPDNEAAEMDGPLGVYFYVKDGADLSFTVTPYGDMLVSSATIKIGEGDAEPLNEPVNDVYSATITGGTEASSDIDAVINIEFAMAQAAIGTTLYPTLAYAVAAAKNGETVKVLEGGELASRLNIAAGKILTIDLNGKTLTRAGDAIRNDGSLTLKGGTITASGNVVYNAAAGAALTVTDGTYTSTGDIAFAVYKAAGTSITVNGGTITAREACIGCYSGTGGNTTITVTGGSLTSTDNGVIMTNGTAGDGNNTIVVSGGTLNGTITTEGYIACGIHVANSDTVTFGGTAVMNVTGGCGIAVRAGVVTVSGGTITTTGSSTGWVGDSKRQLPCAAIVYDVDAAYPGYDSATSKVAITGGMFGSWVAAVQMLGNGLVTSTSNTVVIPSGYKWAETATVGVYQLVVAGIDPTDSTSTQEVTVDTVGKTEEQIAEAAIDAVTVTVPEAVATSGVTEEAYKSYFNYTVTPSATKPGTYEVAINPAADLKEEVVFPESATTATQEIITQAEEVLEAATDTNKSEATVPAVPGIYYSMQASSSLDFPAGDGTTEGAQELSTGSTVTIKKPTQLPSGKAVFFRVKASATPNN